jgi:putative ABC transport system permease protein
LFFVTYLRRELRRRMRQSIFIALGLALGVGLVVTVAAASAGVNKAESTVLSSLYGVGTDVTLSGSVHSPSVTPKGAAEIVDGPHGPEFCFAGEKCISAAGKTLDEMNFLDSGISASDVAEVTRLRGVAAAAGGITLSDTTVSFPKSGAFTPQSGGYTLDGVDTGNTSLGPLSAASLTSGHSFNSADADADVAVVDSGYATSHSLKTGSALTIDGIKFTVIGIVSQLAGNNPPGIYVPLKVAQGFSLQGGSLKGEVNDIYAAASSAADIPEVTKEITGLLPGTEVTSTSNLASEVTGSVTSAAKLANDLGRWLAVLALIAAFAVASLLTIAAVTRRVAEFGTLKAIGWRTRRIVVQVLGESVAVGIAGAAAGTGLGFAGAGIIAAVAPKLTATVGANTMPETSSSRGHFVGGSPLQTVPVPLHPSVTAGVIVLAVVLAIAGGLLAGSFGSWRIARLRPADALSRVA